MTNIDKLELSALSIDFGTRKSNSTLLHPDTTISGINHVVDQISTEINSAYDKINALSNYSQIKNQLSVDGYTVNENLTAYYQKTETSSAAEISTQFLSCIQKSEVSDKLALSSKSNLDEFYQEKGNYSEIGHTHVKSDISDGNFDQYQLSSDMSSYYSKSEYKLINLSGTYKGSTEQFSVFVLSVV